MEKEIVLTPEKLKLLSELVDLGERLALVHYWKVPFPMINHKREEGILRKMKEVVDKILG
jgi:hypothetical protein